MSDNIADTERRFEIYVPSPKARINMGKRNTTDTGPFGYTGVSIQSDVHLFIDANKNTLYQTGQTFCGQVGGQWRQFSNDPMFLSSTAANHLTADDKLIIASGAGQGQITALDHGMNMRLVPYNELKLHYVIDGLQASMLEFFHGRHSRHEDSFRAPFKPVEFKHFFTASNKLVSLSATAAEPLNDGRTGLEGGFIETVSRSWMQMERGVTEKDVGKSTVFPSTVPAIAPILEAGIVKNGDDPLADFEFGYAGYLARFDPYKYGKPDWWLAKLTKAVKILKRFVHVALKYGEVITDLPLINTAIKCMDAANSLMKFAWSGYNMYRDSFPALLAFQRSSDGSFEAGKGGVADEFNSGMAARAGTVASNFGVDDKAEIQSQAEPQGSDPDSDADNGWSIASNTTYVLNVAWKDGSHPNAIRVSRSDAPAVLTVTAPTLSSAPETKTLALTVGSTNQTVSLTVANTKDLTQYASAVEAAVGSLATVTKDTGDSTITITGERRVSLDGGAASAELTWTKPAAIAEGDPAVDHDVDVNGETVTLSLGHAETADLGSFQTAMEAALEDHADVETEGADSIKITPRTGAVVTLRDANDTKALLGRMNVSAGAMRNETDELTLGMPALRQDGEIEELTLTIDGNRFTIPLRPGTNLRSELDAIAQVGVLADVAGTGLGPITITTKSRSARSCVKAQGLVEDDWTFSPSEAEAYGSSGIGPLLTLSELEGLFPDLEGASVSTEDGKLALEAVAAGEGSKIEVTGNLASLVFGADPTEETLTTDTATTTTGFDDWEDTLSTLRGWNHELQKLPEDTRNLTRPLTNALQDTLSAASALEGMLKKVTEIVNDFRGKGQPGPPEAIGLMANDGITLGTQDRIVGSGGKGIVFISDGGTGSPDRAKFVLSEGWVADITQWSASFWDRPSSDEDSVRSLGFRVLSDSHIDMTSVATATLAAMGRGKPAEARPDGRSDAVGIGLARVVGSYAAEVAGYEKVVVSARNPGKDGDETGLTGGRVELLGQRLVIGSVELENTLGNGVAQALTDRASIGTEVIGLEQLAGSEHLEDGEDSDAAYLESPTMGQAWSAELRAKHPDTTHVGIHATTRLEQAVLPYSLTLTKDGADFGVVTPVEADRRAELLDEKNRAEAVKTRLEQDYASYTTMQQSYAASALEAKLERDIPLNIPFAGSYNEYIELCENNADYFSAKANECKAQLDEALVAFQNATAAHSNFSNDWDAKAFPRLQVTEDSIKLGFVAGSGDWEDFAYLEITKDGVQIYQPKSKGIPTFDTKSGVGTISSGSKDASVVAKGSDLTVTFGNCKAGPLVMDKGGNVKIG